MVTITSIPVNGGGYITCVAVSPSSPNVVYASTDIGGICRSTNYGEKWSLILKGLNTDADFAVTTVTVDPKNSNIAYIGTGQIWGNPVGNYGGIFKTTNGGQSWEISSRDIKFAACGSFDVQGRLISVDPKNSNIVYAGSHRDGLFKSLNAGRTWSCIGLTGKYISSVVIDPINSNIIYVTSQNAVSPTPGIYKSTNSGVNWSTLSTSYNAYDLTIDAKNPQTLYVAAFDKGVYKSTNGGSSWSNKTPSGASGQQFVSISASPSNPQVVYSKTRSMSKVFITKNGGDSWAPNGTVHTDGWFFTDPKFGLSSSPITADPVDENKAYTGNWYSVFRTDNTGKDWTVKPKGLETSCGFDCTVNPRVPNEIYECHPDIGLFKSSNRGVTWTRMAAVGGNSWAIAIDKTTNPSTVYAGTGNWSGNTTNGKVFKSTNGGSSWANSSSGLSDSRVRTIEISPTDSSIIYAGQTNGRIYKSTNKAGSWSNKSTGLGSSEVLKIAIDPSNSNIVYAVQKTHGVSKTTNGGSSWTRINGNISRIYMHGVAIDPNNPNIVYVACKNDGIYRSTNKGSSWTKVLSSFGGRSVTVDPNSIVYAGGRNEWSSSTTSGLYRSTNGINFTRIDNGYLSQNIENIEVDPTDTSKIYISTACSGTFLVKMDGSSSPTPTITPTPHPTITPTPHPTITPTPHPTSTPIPGQYQYVTKQAEEYVQINPPMVKVPHVTSNGNFYVHCPSGHTMGGYVRYNFSVAKSGRYKIAALVNADHQNHNSFSVVFDSISPAIWDIVPKSTWQWVHVSSRGNGSEFSPQYPIMYVDLSAGAHILYIYDRNEQTKLKKLVITNNLSYVPGAPLPTEHAINLISNPPGAQVHIWKP